MGEAKRKKEAVLDAPCPCGCGKIARNCCFVDGRWHRRASKLGLSQLPTGTVVNRCYMKELGSCVGPISGEHLVSEAVIKVLQGSAGFSISGVPWLEEGEERILAPKNLRANCLCTRHNSALSAIDEAAQYFFMSLKTYLEQDVGKPRHALISGHDMEIWLLKTAKALAVSCNLSRLKVRLSGKFSQDQYIIGMIDEPDRWPIGAGLYCLMQEGDLLVNHSRMQLVPWTNERDEIVALNVNFLGIIFVLLLEPLDLEKYPMLKNGNCILDKEQTRTHGKMRQAGANTELEITPAMVEAGVAELFENFRLAGDWRDLVSGIYLAMVQTSPQQLRQETEAI